MEKKQPQQKMGKYDRELIEQLSAVRFGTCRSKGGAVEPEESGCAYFTAILENSASVPISAILKLQSFLREEFNLQSTLAGCHSPMSLSASPSPPQNSDQVILFLETAQRFFPSPQELMPHCTFLLKLGMSRVGLHGDFLLSTDDCSVMNLVS